MPFVKQVSDEGLPSVGNPFVKGDLYILFRVQFPTEGQLNADQIKTLKAILPQPDEGYDTEVDDDVEVVHMDIADLTHFGKGGAEMSGDRAYDSDGPADGQPVQCQQS